MDDSVVIPSAANEDPAPNDESTSFGADFISAQEQPATGPLFRPPPRDRKWLVSLGTALAIHAGVIAAAGYAVYKAHEHYDAQRLVLPVGWATEFDGSGERGAAASLLRPQPPLTIDAPPAADEPSVKSLLGPPPSEFQPPEPAPPPLAIDPAEGTGDVAIPARSNDASPPLFPLHAPPGMGNVTDDATATSSAPAADSTSGKSDAGSGISTGGGPQGVPDGVPVPSFKNRLPLYPPDAARQRWAGTVYLGLDLDTTGRVTAVRLLRSSGYDLLDQAAIDQARSWKYTPATVNGQPVAITLTFPVNFTLK